ncbi:MAG: MFS transporter [Chloroflexi bacterium]|nr:MFS transporter [Chloroflexota bacterium]
MAALLTRGLTKKVYYGWWIVAAFFLAEFTAAGAGGFTFGFYLKPMSQEFGWSRSQVVFALTIRSFVTLFTSPLIGVLLDRYGPRFLVTIGAFIGGVTLISLFFLDSLWHWLLAYGVGEAFGLGLTGALVTQVTVSKWFVRRRGRAIAITAFGIGFGAMVMTPVTQLIISTAGWRSAWLFFGILQLAVTLPVAFLILRRSPEDLGLLPDGDTTPGSLADSTSSGQRGRVVEAQEVSWTVAEAARTRTLWLMVGAFSVSGLALSPILTHQAAYITDLGFSDGVAVTIVTIFSAMSSVANLVWGLLGERIPIRKLVVTSFLLAAMGVAFLLGAGNVLFLGLYVVVYGATRNVASMTGLAYANYWGRGFQGSIRGFVQPVSVLASASGPLLAAFIFDLRGSYAMAFAASLVLFLAAALLMGLAAPPQKARPSSATTALSGGG